MATTLFLIVIDPFLRFGFLQRALFAGIFISLACALLGVFIILRRDAMIGHGLAHITFAGVALGLLINILPLYAALVFAVATALIIMAIKGRAGVYGDTAIAIFSSVGLALGVILASAAGGFNVDLLSYLFGDILAIKSSEIWLSIILAGTVISAVIVNYHRLLYMTFDSDSAKASGIKIRRLDIMITILTAVTIVLGMRIVGILLVAALLVIPSAAGLQASRSFRQALLMSSLYALGSVAGGLVVSFQLDLPASGVIVILSFFFFLFSLGIKSLVH